MHKRKISYDQDMALARGRNVARNNQRRRVTQNQEDARRAAERAEADRNHVHGWKNWDYVMNHTHEVRECRDCGFAEIRKVRI